MKYLAYYNKEFVEFNNWPDLEYFLADKANVPFRKITSDKKEEEFRREYSGKDMPLNKIYVAIKDGKVYRFEKWKDCYEFVGDDHSIKFKSFVNEEEAQQFINKNIHRYLKDADDVLYCFIHPNVTSTSIKFDDTAYKLVRNNVTEQEVPFGPLYKEDFISRELKSVLHAVKEAIANNEERIVIAYQNPGVEMWANGSWQAKKDITRKYIDEISELGKKINIDYIDGK